MAKTLYVAAGKSVCTIIGIKSEGEEITAKMIKGGQKQLDLLDKSKKNILTDKKPEKSKEEIAADKKAKADADAKAKADADAKAKADADAKAKADADAKAKADADANKDGDSGNISGPGPGDGRP